MKRELFLEVVSGELLLAKIVQTVCTTREPPESFVWSAIPDTGEARVWMIVSVGETGFNGLVADLGAIPGVKAIATQGPGQSIIERLILPPASR